MGDAYWELDQPEQAVQAWEHSRAVTENADAISRLYTFHRKQQDLSSILADLQALHRLQPGDAALAYQLAVQLTVSSPQEALIFINKTRIEDEIIQSKLKNLSASLQAAVQRLPQRSSCWSRVKAWQSWRMGTGRAGFPAVARARACLR